MPPEDDAGMINNNAREKGKCSAMIRERRHLLLPGFPFTAEEEAGAGQAADLRGHALSLQTPLVTPSKILDPELGKMASERVETNHGAPGSHCASPSPPWKLYHNPHFCFHVDGNYSPSRSSCQGRRDEEPPMIIVFENDGNDFGGGVQEVELDQGYGAMSSELELCVDRIRELRAELEFERRMRRKAEALVAELAEERRHGEAECRALREEAAAARAEAEEAEEERRMLRVAELWREERVQMKLADARAAMEEKLREVHDAVAELHAAAAVAGGRTMSISSPVGKSSPCRSQQYGQQGPSRTGQPHRRVRDRDASGGENPHIRRGIKGFVEFPKAARLARPREERADLVSNLECQRAQLRVLMRHRSPAAGMGLIGAADNLVV